MINAKKLPLLLFLLSWACKDPSVPSPVYPIPTERQLIWHKLEYYGFIHFNINTFTDMEWGKGDENPAIFDPTALDTRQWAKVAKEAGMKGLIITAKHHDGFCLWPSKYTEHSVKNSPWKDGNGDLIKELAESCKAEGIGLGIYYSPWDRNHADYGDEAYIDYMKNQLTELLSNYGELFEIWFDGANGGTGHYGGANEERKVDKRGYYPWESIYELVRKLQPNAVIFGDAGPDVRWVGNEEGHAYPSTWSNLMRDSVYAGMPEYSEKYARGQENGSHWVPAEADVSIRPGWYYHAYEDHKVKSLSHLLDIYYKSIGQNSALLINFPVDRRGLIHENDVDQIMKLSTKIKEDFETDLIHDAKLTASSKRGKGYEINKVLDDEWKSYWTTKDGITNASVEIEFPGKIIFNRFLIQEYIALGQRVKEFSLEIQTDNGWENIYKGTTIGAKRILRLEDHKTNKIKLTILDAIAPPTISKIGIFNAPKLLVQPVIHRNKDGLVKMEVPETGVDIFYTLDGSTPSIPNGKQFTKPFTMKHAGKINAISIDQSKGKFSEHLELKFDIAKSNWEVIHDDPNSINIIDDNPNTIWTNPKNEVVVDLGELIHITGFDYLPPQGRYFGGLIFKYRFSGSLDGKNWHDLAIGEFSNIHNNPIRQEVRFEKVQTRFVKLTSLETWDGNATQYAEIGVLTQE
ncbi:alpha-L-fucosidase [Belliella sp. DSM 111904]|uniref:alpha-L-fucosidase n=1 Tax=Belliella filtrata TaxID=2923435 RepID=A0ABS9UV73_9BACT|nr:alpha-L-fucosidase [Belliella filtrata]MCH7408036.1 alpha-L-fucosidase [Belliella filtrata]